MDLTDDAALTRCRHERKIAVDPLLADELARQLEARCGLETPPQTRITSVYFDTADGRLAAAALSAPTRCLKVRTKEYAPDLAAPAVARCVVEIKQRRGTLTRKRRFWVSRSELLAVFEEVPDGLPASPRALDARAALAPRGRLEPVVAVTYLRRVYALGRGLRVTFDRDVAFHLAPAELLLGSAPLRYERLPQPFAREERRVVEIKHQGAIAPAWAAPLLAAQECGFSKFGAAVALLGAQRPLGAERATV